jgi:hypothetical protein
MNTLTEIGQLLEANIYYPVDAYIWEPGKAVYEFPFIQKLSERKFIVHIQRHYALNPFQLAEKAKWSFNNLNDAYKKWHNLENGIF